jgi:hypothetical protein
MDPQRRPTSPYWTVGAIYGATAVALGAFGAHGLKKRIADPARIANWGTAAQYQVRSREVLSPAYITLIPPREYQLLNSHHPNVLLNPFCLVRILTPLLNS